MAEILPSSLEWRVHKSALPDIFHRDYAGGGVEEHSLAGSLNHACLVLSASAQVVGPHVLTTQYQVHSEALYLVQAQSM